jgi:NAD(P)-dependent dehydrogenase (short-subunit alcohol dehydrogenase family)
MSICEGRVAIITGAGRGLGRAYALKLAAQGAKIVVNDLGGETSGIGADPTPAQQVVAEIRAGGGDAIADGSDVSNWQEAGGMIDRAVATFGKLDILINNAGILRDRMLVNMTEDEWDSVIRVHLKGTFAPAHHAANYWRRESKAGRQLDARLINTTSASGLFGNIGQANYAAAKAGIASFTLVAARELSRIGVTVNAVAPRAQTRMTSELKEFKEFTEEELIRRDPEWIAALVTWLASSASKDISGRVIEAWGNGYSVAEGWTPGPLMQATRDPAAVEEGFRHIISAARYNAGIDRDTWVNP